MTLIKTLFNNPETHAFQAMFVNKIIIQIREIEGSAFPPEKEKYILAFVVQGCFSLIREWINSGFDLPSNEITDLIIQLYTASLTINIGMEKMTGGDQR